MTASMIVRFRSIWNNAYFPSWTQKIDLSSDALFWIFWPILIELHSQNKVTFSVKIPCQFLCLPTTLWRLISPFPNKLASHNSIQKKDDKVGNKTANKKGKGKEESQTEILK